MLTNMSIINIIDNSSIVYTFPLDWRWKPRAMYSVCGRPVETHKLVPYRIPPCELEFVKMYDPSISLWIVAYCGNPQGYINILACMHPGYEMLVLWALNKTYRPGG